VNRRISRLHAAGGMAVAAVMLSGCATSCGDQVKAGSAVGTRAGSDAVVRKSRCTRHGSDPRRVWSHFVKVVLG